MQRRKIQTMENVIGFAKISMSSRLCWKRINLQFFYSQFQVLKNVTCNFHYGYPNVIIFTLLWLSRRAAAPIGAYVLSTQVVGVLYDKQAAIYRSQTLPSTVGENTCLGTPCFGAPLLVLALLCFVSAMVTFWFMMRTRSFYHQPEASPSPRKVQPFVSL